jgi:gamma-glutamylcyclotransferase (GGCT)/AIG2-like uncharacterized protein YtfP
MAEFLFVYGTLMKATEHPMADELSRHARFVGGAVFNGRLYRLQGYPGAVASADAGDRVHGELYELTDAERVLPILDRYEGCAAGAEQPTEYSRELRSVLMEETPFKAWIYLYNYAVDGRERIASGRYADAPKPQSGSI